MKNISVVIVDDEEFAIIDIKEELQAYSNIEIVGEFEDGIEGMKGINRLNPDLVFVDIEMPGVNGFEMLGRLTCSPAVIFCTGFGKYAIDGYAYEPTDFLLKPLKSKRFQSAMERAFKDIERKDLEQRLNRQKQQVGYILLEYRDLHGEARKVCIWPEDLVFVRPQENNANYIEYHLLDGSEHVVKKTLKTALSELTEHHFVQVHRQYIVNGTKIREFYKNEVLIMNTPENQEIPVSRGYRKSVKSYLKST